MCQKQFILSPMRRPRTTVTIANYIGSAETASSDMAAEYLALKSDAGVDWGASARRAPTAAEQVCRRPGFFKKSERARLAEAGRARRRWRLE